MRTHSPNSIRTRKKNKLCQKKLLGGTGAFGMPPHLFGVYVLMAFFAILFKNMKYAIIAAGEGSRLQQEGVELPKPLVTVCGEAMIDRLIRIFRKNGAEEIVVIVNRLNPLPERYIRKMQEEGVAGDVRLIVKTTPSSMHSFACISPYLDGGPFCLTTVDTIFRENEFSEFVSYFQNSHTDGCMAVTDFIDDEKPLYVSTDERMQITGFHDTNEGYRYISGGIYCLHPAALKTLGRCLEEGVSRMRNFQRALVADGFKLEAYPFSKILDVDHAEDIRKAEDFLNCRIS